MRAVAPGGLVPGLAVGGDDLVIGQDHVTLLLIAEGKLPPSRGRRRLCFLPPRLSTLPSAGGAPGAWRLGGRRRWCVADTGFVLALGAAQRLSSPPSSKAARPQGR